MFVNSFVVGAFVFCFFVDAQIWSPPTPLSVDSEPVVEVRLAPPDHAFPELSAEFGVLENARQTSEAAMRQELATSSASALRSAQAEIDSTIQRTMSVFHKRRDGPRAASFLRARNGIIAAELPQQSYAIKVSLNPMPPLDQKVQTAIELIENKRAHAEEHTFEQAKAELQGLTHIVLNQLGAQMQSHISTLQRVRGAMSESKWLEISRKLGHRGLAGLPAQANVRVASAHDAFPTVAELTQEMENRRDIVEVKDRGEILALELKFLQEVNDMIKKAVASAVFRVMVES